MIKIIILIVIGIIVGGGFFLGIACCKASAESDKAMEEYYRKLDAESKEIEES